MEIQNKIVINRTFNCSASELFNWLIQPELLLKWFGPKQLLTETVKTDVRIGGAYTIQLRKPDLQSFIITGEYIAINKPHSLVFSFRYKGLASPPPESIVKIRIEESAPNRSTLYLTQDFEFTPPDMANRTKAWEHMFGALEEQIGIITN